MKYLSTRFLRQTNFLFMRSFMILFLSFLAMQLNLCFSNIPSSLTKLCIDGHFSFTDNEFAATDYGNHYQALPLAVLHPQSVSDIASTIRHVWELGRDSELTVAARGHGHSINGQAQAHQGIIVSMRTLQRPKMRVHTGSSPYVDVSGGELWINILRESLKYGLTPKSWTDYLHLTVGGTLSNAGISGQAFRHGPQISNVHQLEVVTGKGEVVKCSEQQNTDLFYAVLGGLGQFGIITRARVSLEPAAKMVKWIRVLYTDFATFSRDQESLISAAHTFNYIEGFVIKNRKDLLNSWRSSFNPKDAFQASQFKSEGRTLFCLELAMYFNPTETNIYQEIENLMAKLSYIPSTNFHSEIPYDEFLDRVHASELKLRSKGMWDIPHPWLNLLIPKSKIGDFAQEVFGNILTDTNTGPVLVYPVHKSRWDNRTSAVLPEEDIFYLVGFLSHVVPSSTGTDGLEHILTRNRRILAFCEAAQLGVKQYLPHYTSQDDWRTHFGPRWDVLVQRKSAYDPHAILAPGQGIFQKAVYYL